MPFRPENALKAKATMLLNRRVCSDLIRPGPGGYSNTPGGYSDMLREYFNTLRGYSDMLRRYSDTPGRYSDTCRIYLILPGRYSDTLRGYSILPGRYSDTRRRYSDTRRSVCIYSLCNSLFPGCSKKELL